MAPENKTCQVSTTKSDIFSLGIILFELFTQFDTDMERAVMLNKLRSSGKIPQFLSDQYPKQSNLLRQLISPVPAERPTAQDILSSDIFVRDSRRVTVSSFGGSESPATDFSLKFYPPLRETKSAMCLETPSPDNLYARHRRPTADIIWMPSHLLQGDDQTLGIPVENGGKYSSSYNQATYIRPEINTVSSSFDHKDDCSQVDPKLRILALERDVECLEAKLRAMTAHYQIIESELERSHAIGSFEPALSPVSNDSKSSIPIPIPFRKYE